MKIINLILAFLLFASFRIKCTNFDKNNLFSDFEVLNGNKYRLFKKSKTSQNNFFNNESLLASKSVERKLKKTKIDTTFLQNPSITSLISGFNNEEEFFHNIIEIDPLTKFDKIYELIDTKFQQKEIKSEQKTTYLNTCNCPYTKEIEQQFKYDDLLPKNEPKTILINNILYFLKKSIDDFVIHKTRFQLGSLMISSIKVEEVSTEITTDNEFLKEHLFTNCESNKNEKIGCKIIKTSVVLTNRQNNRFSDDLLSIYFILKVEEESKNGVESSVSGHSFNIYSKLLLAKVNSEKNLKIETGQLSIIEKIETGNNFISNICVYGRTIASQIIRFNVNRYNPEFKSINWCSGLNFIDKYENPPIVDFSENKVKSHNNELISFHLKESTQNAIEVKTEIRLLDFPDKEIISNSFIPEINSNTEKNKKSIDIDEVSYSEHFERFSEIVYQNDAKSENKSKNQEDLNNALLKILNGKSLNICEKINFILIWEKCLFNNQKLCRNLAYLRSINLFTFECGKQSFCEENPLKSFSIDVIFEKKKIAWFSFSLSNDNKSDDSNKNNFCYESEWSYLTRINNYLFCFEESSLEKENSEENDKKDGLKPISDLSVQKLENQDKSSSQILNFLTHFSEQVITLEQILLGRINKYELAEFVLLVVQDFETNQKNNKSPNKELQAESALEKMWNDFEVRKDIDFHVSEKGLFFSGKMLNTPESMFNVDIVEKDEGFLYLRLSTPSKTTEVYVNKDIDAKFQKSTSALSLEQIKLEKFGKLFSHFGLQVFEFFYSISTLAHEEKRKTTEDLESNKICSSFLQNYFLSENLSFSTMMSFIQIVMSENEYMRIFSEKITTETSSKYFGEKDGCDQNKNFGVILLDEPNPLKDSILQKTVVDPLNVEDNTKDPFDDWLFYLTEEDYKIDSKFIDHTAEIKPIDKRDPIATYLTLPQVLDFSLENEFKTGKETFIEFWFGSKKNYRKLNLKAFYYGSGLFKSVHLILNDVYFDRETIVMLSSPVEAAVHIREMIQLFTKKVDDMAKMPKNNGVQTTYNLPKVKEIVDEVLESRGSEYPFGKLCYFEQKNENIVEKIVYQVLDKTETLVETNLRKLSNIDRKLLKATECPSLPEHPLITISFISSAKKQITISVQNNVVTSSLKGKLDPAFHDSYIFQTVYPLKHEQFLKEHITEMIAKIKNS